LSESRKISFEKAPITYVGVYHSRVGLL